jgi:hypothetical protein
MVLLFQTPLGLLAAYCWARVPTAEHGPPESFLAYVQPSETRRKLAFSDCLPNPSSSHLWSLDCPPEHLKIPWAKTEYSASPDPARRYKLKFQTGNAGCRILKFETARITGFLELSASGTYATTSALAPPSYHKVSRGRHLVSTSVC